MIRLCQFTGVGSSTEKGGKRELKIREAGEQDTGGGRFWPPCPTSHSISGRNDLKFAHRRSFASFHVIMRLFLFFREMFFAQSPSCQGPTG